MGDGQRLDSSQFNRLKKSHQIIDTIGNVAGMLIAVPQSGELLFWDQNDGLRQRALKQTGKIVAARYIDRGKRFAIVFSKPPSIYYGDVESDENDSTVPLETEIYKSAISPQWQFGSRAKRARHRHLGCKERRPSHEIET